MEHFPKSHRLENVRYEIRGPVLQEAMKMEEAGHQIIKLNIGNPAPFGFEAPDEIVMDIIRNLPTSQGYCDSKGLYSARKAIVQYYQSHGIPAKEAGDLYLVIHIAVPEANSEADRALWQQLADHYAQSAH